MNLFCNSKFHDKGFSNNPMSVAGVRWRFVAEIGFTKLCDTIKIKWRKFVWPCRFIKWRVSLLMVAQPCRMETSKRFNFPIGGWLSFNAVKLNSAASEDDIAQVARPPRDLSVPSGIGANVTPVAGFSWLILRAQNRHAFASGKVKLGDNQSPRFILWDRVWSYRCIRDHSW